VPARDAVRIHAGGARAGFDRAESAGLIAGARATLVECLTRASVFDDRVRYVVRGARDNEPRISDMSSENKNAAA